MKTLDDAWNNQDWDTFNKRHAETVAVYWPGQPEPTIGRPNHNAESQSPVDNIDNLWNASEKYAVNSMIEYSFAGGPSIVKSLLSFLNSIQVDEIMTVSHIFDRTERLRSYEILSTI